MLESHSNQQLLHQIRKRTDVLAIHIKICFIANHQFLKG